MTIRQATLADIDAMHRVRLAVRENVLSSATRISAVDYVEAIEATGKGWVAECDGHVVAFAVGNAVDGNIWALFVEPSYEGLGFGRTLHDEMVAWLGLQGLQQLWLTTEPGSRAADFYTAAGWREVGKTACGELRFELDVV